MSIFEKMIATISPEWGLKRKMASIRYTAIDSVSNTFKAARKDKRSLGTWNTYLSDPNVEYGVASRKEISARSRDAKHNQPLAGASINRIVTNAIGTGLKLQSHIDYETLRITADVASDLEAKLERYWTLWANDPNECDIEGKKDFYSIQSMALLSALLNGDVFVSTPYQETKGHIFGLKCQIIEGDRVCNPLNTVNTEILTDGIEHDLVGKPLYFYILQTHPNNIWDVQRANTWDKIPVWSSTGDRRIFQLMFGERPGQMRGIPFLTPVLETLKQLDRYLEAEAMASVIASMFTVFVKSESALPLGGMSPVPNNATAIEKNASASDELRMGPGAILNLLPGETIETANPSRPNTSFENFVNAVVKQIGACLEIPQELLLLSFQGSYSAARASLLEAWKSYMNRRHSVSYMLCQPIYELFIDELVLKRIVDLPGYLDSPLNKAAYTNASWIGPSKGSIDEPAAVTAAQARIDAGISSIALESAELGNDFKEIHTQRVREKKLRNDAGLEGSSSQPKMESNIDSNIANNAKKEDIGKDDLRMIKDK